MRYFWRSCSKEDICFANGVNTCYCLKRTFSIEYKFKRIWAFFMRCKYLLLKSYKIMEFVKLRGNKFTFFKVLIKNLLNHVKKNSLIYFLKRNYCLLFVEKKYHSEAFADLCTLMCMYVH